MLRNLEVAPNRSLLWRYFKAPLAPNLYTSKYQVVVPTTASSNQNQPQQNQPQQQTTPTLPETNMAPENRPKPKRKVDKVVFQPSIFRGELLVSGRVTLPPQNLHPNPKTCTCVQKKDSCAWKVQISRLKPSEIPSFGSWDRWSSMVAWR